MTGELCKKAQGGNNERDHVFNFVTGEKGKTKEQVIEQLRQTIVYAMRKGCAAVL